MVLPQIYIKEFLRMKMVLAQFLQKNTITDGSVALLTLKNGSRLPTEQDLEFYKYFCVRCFKL